jgi:glycine dehydrogenase subunit 2
VLNSNYLRKKLQGTYDLPYRELRKHEFVLSVKKLADEKGVRALDVAKRLLDYGFMSPTIYFPMLVEEALMIEPTETEIKETLDEFAQAMIEIANENPSLVRDAPHATASTRIDELFAAKELILSWNIYQGKTEKFGRR